MSLGWQHLACAQAGHGEGLPDPFAPQQCGLRGGWSSLEKSSGSLSQAQGTSPPFTFSQHLQPMSVPQRPLLGKPSMSPSLAAPQKPTP